MISFSLAVFLLHLAGPTIVQKRVTPLNFPNIDHWGKPQPGITNEDGILPPIPSSEYRRKDFSIIFLGSSYTFGAKLESYKKAFPTLVEQNLQKLYPYNTIRAANFGNPGSSPIIQLRLPERSGAKYKPDLVVHEIGVAAFFDDIRFVKKLQLAGRGGPYEITIFRAIEVLFSQAMNVPDYRNWFKTHCRLFQDKNKNPLLPDGSEQTLEELKKKVGKWPGKKCFFPLREPLSESSPYMELTWKIVLETRKTAEKMGAKYMLIILPRCQHYDLNGCPIDHITPQGGQMPKSGKHLFEIFNFFEKKAKTVDFPIHSLLPDFKNCGISPTVFPDDPHFNHEGHKVAAKAITKYIINDGLISDK